MIAQSDYSTNHEVPVRADLFMMYGAKLFVDYKQKRV